MFAFLVLREHVDTQEHVAMGLDKECDLSYQAPITASYTKSLKFSCVSLEKTLLVVPVINIQKVRVEFK
jgi:hypothetical protein